MSRAVLTHADPEARFTAVFGRMPEVTAVAPGRVNLMGEHTDYNGGFVLPMAIPQAVRVCLSRREDRIGRAFSESFPGEPESYVLGEEKRGRGWLDYVQGTSWVLAALGQRLQGFEVLISSEVPVGSGLSSSAALDVALLRALRVAFGFELDDVALALAAQRVEVDFVGAPVGVMDPMACSLAQGASALFLDTRDLRFERVSLPSEVEPVVINSGVAHQHSAGDYRLRRAECDLAAALLGVAQLRDLRPEDLERAAALPEPLGRRVQHVVSENARVLAMVEALRGSRLDALGPLLEASHASQRDQYQVSIPQIDLLVDLARGKPGLLGARLTGGGFGGSVVLLAQAGQGATAASEVVAEYDRRSGETATLLVPSPPDTAAAPVPGSRSSVHV